MKNPITIVGDMGKIRLSNGEVAIFDAIYVDFIKKYRWHRIGDYMATWVSASNKRKRTTLCFHKHVLGLYSVDNEGLVGDHINHIKLDNRKINLRAVTAEENRRNDVRKLFIPGKDEFLLKYAVDVGVSKEQIHNFFAARLKTMTTIDKFLNFVDQIANVSHLVGYVEV